MAELYNVDREEDKTMRKKEECNFNQLFQNILQEIRDEENIEDRDIENAITDMKEGFKRFEFPDMEQWKNVCGYLFRYGPHGAGLTRNRVLEAVRKSEDLASCLRKTDLNIVSLGGGPGNDVIGFCSALFECVEKSQREDKLCNLNITVVDKYKNWSICVGHLIKLVLEKEFGNVSELFHLIDVRMSFLQVNIPAGLRNLEDYFHSLRNADVILMVKLILSLDLKSVDCLIETLKKTMKDDTLLLYIDAPIRPMVTNHFDVLFQSNLENYSMSSEISQRFNSNDNFESKAQIAVLRKSSSPPAKKVRIE